MYNMKDYNFYDNNSSIELSVKHGFDTYIHWLNPLFMKCINM
jgi:hypothetical protein